MNVTSNDIAYKKQIGDSKSGPVLEVALKGGWHMVVVGKNKTFQVVGMGPHRGVARYTAQKKEPSIVLHALEKSEPFFVAPILVEKYENMAVEFDKFFDVLR